VKHGAPAGLPSLLAKEERADFTEHIRKIIALMRRYQRELPLSVEVFTEDPMEMIRQAEQFVRAFDYPHLTIKVPIGWDKLQVITDLRKRGIRVNCTCCMSFNQAVMAAQAGANYVSIFYGRIRDTGYDAKLVVEQVCRAFRDGSVKSEVIVGSVRHICDINEAILAGADIVTVPPQFFRQMTAHPKTDEVVSQFVTDFAKWQER
jgi:transaldolase